MVSKLFATVLSFCDMIAVLCDEHGLGLGHVIIILGCHTNGLRNLTVAYDESS